MDWIESIPSIKRVELQPVRIVGVTGYDIADDMIWGLRDIVEEGIFPRSFIKMVDHAAGTSMVVTYDADSEDFTSYTTDSDAPDLQIRDFIGGCCSWEVYLQD